MTPRDCGRTEIDARDDGGRPVACLDSLSTVLQYADPERTFRFLHALAAQFRANGARAVVSVDPRAHDESTLSTLRTLFDDVRGSTSATASGESGRAVATDGGEAEVRGREARDGPSEAPE